MESVDAEPTKYIPPQTQSRAARRRVFHTTFAEFVDKFVLQLDIEAIQAQLEDRVMNFGLCIIEFTVLLLQMIDTVHEGDGDCLIVNLKYLLLMFKAKSSYSKFAVEVLRFLSQVNCTLTEQMGKRVVYGRFFNTAGKQLGRNIEIDLAMEHTIKATKNLVNAMGANKTKKAVQRATRAVGGVQEIVHSYDKCSGVVPSSTAHTRKSSEKDEHQMISDLRKLRPFQSVPARCHSAFPDMVSSPILSINWAAFHAWLNKHRNRMAKGRDNCD